MGVAFMKICPVCSIRYSDETKYCAKCNAYLEECDEEEYVILKVDKDENGEEYLSTIEDDEEFDKAADAFEDEFMSEIDYDAEADETEKTDDTNK